MRRLFALAVQLFLALALLPSTASAQAAKSVTLAVQLSSDTPQILMAIERKLWQAQGLDVKLVPTASGREALEALAGGQADFAVFADLPATIGALRKQPFAIVADVSRYNGQRAIASKKRMRKLDSPADFNNMKVGTTLGTSVEYVAALLIQRGNAKAEIVNATPADIIPALVRGDIDVSVPFPSVFAQAKKLLGDDYLEMKVPNYSAHILLAASPAMLKDRPADVEAFLRGLLAGEEAATRDPRAAKEAVIQASRGVMSMDVLDGMWPDYEHRVVLNAELPKFLAEQAAWVAKKGMIRAEPEMTGVKSISAFIAEKPLAAVAPARVQPMR